MLIHTHFSVFPSVGLQDLGVCVFGLGLGDSQLGAPSRLGKEATAPGGRVFFGLPGTRFVIYDFFLRSQKK